MKKYLLLLIALTMSVLFAQDGNPILITTYQYNATTQEWDLNMKTVKTYNADGLILMEIDSTLAEGDNLLKGEQNGDLQAKYKRSYAYQGESLIKKEVSEYRKGDQTWHQNAQTDFYWGNAGELTSQVDQEWLPSPVDAWAFVRKSEFEYLSNQIQSTTQFNYVDDNWVPTVKETPTYNDQDLVDAMEVWMWNGLDWDLSTQTINTWDPSGNLLQEDVEVWSGGIWTSFQRIERTYTEDNREATYLESFYNSQTGLWDPRNQHLYQFGPEGWPVEVVYQTVPQSANSDNLNKMDSGENTEDDWVLTWKQTFEYQDITSNETGNNLPASFQLYNNYPNPFNPSTNISFTLPNSSKVKLTIHSIIGETVSVLVDDYLHKGSYTKSFNAANLASGIYFYKLETNEFVEVKKMTLIK